MAWVWSNTVFPPAYLGIPYEVGLCTSTATAADTISTTSGALPDGLDYAGANENRITGTPTKTGKFTFKVTCATVESGTFTITVYGSQGDKQKTAELYTPTAANAERLLN